MAMKKIVDVTCDQPFAVGYGSFAGIYKEIVLDTGAILKCLENKAKVAEVLADGTRVPLHFGNFDEDNGPSAVAKDAVLETDAESRPPVKVEVVTAASAKKHEAVEEVTEVVNEAPEIEVIEGEKEDTSPKVVEENVEPEPAKSDITVEAQQEEYVPNKNNNNNKKNKKK